MCHRKILVVFCLLAGAHATVGQIRLPQIDIEVKGGYAPVDAGESDEVKNASYGMGAGGVHIQLGQRIAVGGFYSKSVTGRTRYSNSTDYNLENLSYGIDLRIAGRRSARWRPFLSFVYGKAEFVQHTGSLDLAAETDMLGVDAGIMLRFGRNFYWKVFEVSPRYLQDTIWWLESDLCIEAKTGFLYNIRIKTK